MKFWKKPTKEMIDRTLKLVKKETSRRYFFSRLKNPLWIQPLVERGYFQSPPSIRYFDDGCVQFPSWSELQYLKNVSCDVPEEVINLVLGLPKVDNPSVYNEILAIALRLHGEQSAQLKPKILEYIKLEFAGVDLRLWTYRYADLLAHWTAENQTEAALELTGILIQFVPDPQSEVKEKRRRKNPTDFGTFCETSLKPSPRIGRSEYSKIMSKGVCPLAEKEPCQVARLLTEAAVNMIRLRTRQEEINQGIDSSEIWYERLDGLDTDYGAPDKTLVHTLIFACKQVYEKSPDSVMALDKVLRNQQWGVFKGLRQHLYAQYANEQTKPWIRELILEHEGYHLWEHRYEFQRMIRSACEHFGETLLTKAERAHIFDAIRSGPSKASYQARVVEGLGQEFTEERFQQRQRGFHRKQFKPFKAVLFDEYKTYFRELEAKTTVPISDEDYPPMKTRGGYVLTRSPRSPEALASLTDEELLSYINEWEGNELFSESEGDGLVEINIKGLAGAFRTVFKETIILNTSRLRFWLDNLKEMRPIYVRAMIEGMRLHVEEKNFDNLNEWFTSSEWILSHTKRDEYKIDDESQENGEWYNLREIVGGFIETCIEKDVDVPVGARGHLAKLLEMLCTQFDRHLDQKEAGLSIQNDLIDEAINNTRGRALEALVRFGFWLRRHDSASKVSEMTTILEKRFAPETESPLTLPEYAILGKDYRLIFSLDKTWAAEHRSDFFPQDKLPAWLAAFSSFVSHNRPFEDIFEIFQDDFDFALQYLTDFKKQDGSDKKQVDSLGHPMKRNSPEEKLPESIGRHLFTYYLWGMYLLKRSARNNDYDSLLERYYEAIDNNREHWANLFNYVGRILWSTSNQLDKDLEDRITTFFDWRFEVKEPRELRQFTFWLKAKCLNAEWRLDAYSKILDVCKSDEASIAIEVEALCEMLPAHTAKVIECFVKLTDGRRYDNIYIQTKEAKIILRAGFKSSDESVSRNAERARENLLRGGRFDLLDLDD